MPLTALLPLFVSLLPVAAPAPTVSEATVTEARSPREATAKLTAAWEQDVLVLSGIEPGANLRVYDVVGRVLADFRSQSPSVRLQLTRRQLVAVCAEGECVGAR